VIEAGDVPDGWEDRWRAFHHGIVVGRFWVGPPWEEAPSGAEAIVIDPGRAFGTGGHPTTRLSLELLQELEPARLLDIGCGSGVLSIAGAKLGFEVTAIDVDDVAIEATLANARVNGVEISAYRLDALVDELPETDVAVANIALDVVELVLPRVSAGSAVTSGYLDSQQPDVEGWWPRDNRDLDGWAADLLEHA